MKDVRIFTGKQVHPVLETVMGLLECRKDNPIYEELEESFFEFEEEVKKRAIPKAAVVFDTILEGVDAGVLKEGTEVMYAVLTVGDGITKLSREYFEKGDYLLGMLLDAMADSCLFQFEEELIPTIKQLCVATNRGIERRYEAPTDIPMEIQKTAFYAVDAERTLNLSISSGYMYHPIKSTCQVFELTKDTKRFEMEHNCGACEKKDCPVRKIYSVELKVTAPEGEYCFTCRKGSKLMEELRKKELFLTAACGGMGKCGKCSIRVVEGSLPITAEDEEFFSQEELAGGIRLACMAVLTEDVHISMKGEDSLSFSVLGAETTEEDTSNERDFGIAIDIGTTTIAISLVGRSGTGVYDTYTAMNRQRAYGSDVIARIQASSEGKSEQLKATIIEDLKTGIFSLLDKNHVSPEAVSGVAIAANTTMQHLLMGYSCETLGVYPFTPVSIKEATYNYKEVFGTNELSNAQVTLLPGISTFVGSDITAGMYQCGFHTNKGVSLLVDLGTNGEMAIGNADKILVTSTAAGPAFEGGNITWGMGSVKGAISRVRILGDQAEIETILDAPAVGICGTGVVEATAELLLAELVDETGMLEEDYFEDGFPLAKTEDGKIITFTQKDIREIQLAKSAIRAGIETLLLRYGITYEEVEQVYLAGGFGFYMDQAKAAVIGMLPGELAAKTVAAGNTSLGGAIRFLTNKDGSEVMAKLAEKSTEIPLSTDVTFNELYMEHMMFEV